MAHAVCPPGRMATAMRLGSCEMGMTHAMVATLSMPVTSRAVTSVTVVGTSSVAISLPVNLLNDSVITISSMRQLLRDVVSFLHNETTSLSNCLIFPVIAPT